MGMAASQARLVQLTARKTNVEFQGQQINQQRTELANQSAGLFSQLMELQVPTAPSTSDYTTLQYTFSDGVNNCTISDITNLTGDPDYNAQVTYYYNSTAYEGIGRTRMDLGVNLVGGTYWLTNGQGVNRTQLTQCVDDPDSEDYAADHRAILQACIDKEDTTLRDACGYVPATQTITNIDGAYKYTANGITYYYSEDDLEAAAALIPPGTATSLTGYYATDVTRQVYNTANAYLDTADSGRYSDITLEGYSTSFDLTATNSTDSNAYNDAMNEYEYQQTLYQQEVTNINARTSIVQQEDRILELKLKQLDTEQEALSTEMDSVKKVVDKNIEQTYKTFQ